MALALRLAIIPWFSDPFNYHVFSLTASMVQAGENPWLAIPADPAFAKVNPWGYPPLYLTPVLGASAISLGNGFVFGLLIRLPLVAVALLTSVFIQRTALALGVSPENARRAALAYAFNPFVILVDSIWGTNDPLPALCTVASLYFLIRSPRRADLSALLLGLGIAFKVYPVVLLPLALAASQGWRARLRYLVFAAVPSALTAGPVLFLSPGQFLNIIGLFVTGSGSPATPLTLPYLATEWGLKGPSLSTPSFAVYLASITVLAYLHSRGRISLSRAAAVTLLGIFLVAPRVNENYFLWPIAAVAVCAASEPWLRAGRLAARWVWVPLATSVLIYNGASGITGIDYWALIAGAPPGRPYEYFPPSFRTALTAAVLACVAAAVLTLVVRRGAAEPPEPGRTLVARLRPPRALTPARALAVGCAAFLLACPYVASLDRQVLPEDFGAYRVEGGRVVNADEFRNVLLDLTWKFQGTGFFDLNPAGRGTLALDTIGPGNASFVERLAPNMSIDIEIVFRVDRVDGSLQEVQIARVPAGWVGVEYVPNALPRPGYYLEYLDDLAPFRHNLGEIALGDFHTVSLTISPTSTTVRYGSASASGQGAPITSLKFGHPDAIPGAGGRVTIDRVSLSWAEPPELRAPALGAILVVTGLAAVVVPVVWWRRLPT